ncbi:uracil-DNA glycosylase family protein [Acetobacter estunensis]|uniref:uracil-DNA glycosylase family protein n=1 Tax=Acetobacter estunensis TaxID=104097 RepID=UPI001C2D5334|nr:uracil-DNA glycosylase family protein [Acetobacter estunensis]MBV1837018.1 uracil-DNA glycosylase [Acetobacter estunensis]
MSVLPSPVIDTALAHEPAADCPLCPRIVQSRALSPGHAPLPPRGPQNAPLLIVGLAPAPHADGTNTLFPDLQAEELLHEILEEFAFGTCATQSGNAQGFTPTAARMVSAMRCAPPAGLPQPSEIATCNQFLRSELQTMADLRIVLALGLLAHNATVAACGIPLSRVSFRHNRLTTMPDGLRIADTHHLSARNLTTGLVTREGLRRLIGDIRQEIDTHSAVF